MCGKNEQKLFETLTNTEIATVIGGTLPLSSLSLFVPKPSTSAGNGAFAQAPEGGTQGPASYNPVVFGD
jgi:hypothetical protein